MNVLDQWVERMKKTKDPSPALYLYPSEKVKICGGTSYVRLPLKEQVYICVTGKTVVLTTVDPDTIYGAIGLSVDWPDLKDGPAVANKP